MKAAVLDILYVSGRAASLLQSHFNDALTVGGRHWKRNDHSRISLYIQGRTARIFVDKYWLHCSAPSLTQDSILYLLLSFRQKNLGFERVWGQMMSDQKSLHFFAPMETKEAIPHRTKGLCNFSQSLLFPPPLRNPSLALCPTHTLVVNVAWKRHYPQRELRDHSLPLKILPHTLIPIALLPCGCACCCNVNVSCKSQRSKPGGVEVIHH